MVRFKMGQMEMARLLRLKVVSVKTMLKALARAACQGQRRDDGPTKREAPQQDRMERRNLGL
jgi:hypothetical protein